LRILPFRKEIDMNSSDQLAPMASSRISTEGEAAMREMIKLNASLEFKELLGKIILSLTTLTVAIAPAFLAFTTGSISLLFLWMTWPAVNIIQLMIQRHVRSLRNTRGYVWHFVHYVTWYIIYSISSGPSWFFWVYLGLIAGNHLLYITPKVINYKIRNLSETDGWKEVKSHYSSHEST